MRTLRRIVGFVLILYMIVAVVVSFREPLFNFAGFDRAFSVVMFYLAALVFVIAVAIVFIDDN